MMHRRTAKETAGKTRLIGKTQDEERHQQHDEQIGISKAEKEHKNHGDGFHHVTSAPQPTGIVLSHQSGNENADKKLRQTAKDRAGMIGCVDIERGVRTHRMLQK